MTNLEISFLAMLGTCTVVMVVFSLIGGLIGPRIGRWLTTRFPDHVARIERERAAKGLAVAPRTPKPQRRQKCWLRAMGLLAGQGKARCAFCALRWN